MRAAEEVHVGPLTALEMSLDYLEGFSQASGNTLDLSRRE